MTSDLRQHIASTCAELGVDELRVIDLIASRLLVGLKQYGALNIAEDRRDWRAQADEEWADAAVYAAIDLLKRGHR